MSVECLCDFDVTNLTSFKVGGKIKKVYFPKSLDELLEVAGLEKDFEVFGNFSNTLVSTDGYDGAVIVTTKFDEVKIDKNRVYAACGVKGPKLAQIVAKEGLSGFEFMIGFPGTIGGNVYMNASAHGQCISDKLIRVLCFTKENGVFWKSKEEMDFSYRTSICQKEKIIILGAEFVLDEKSSDEVSAKMTENLAFRKAHQPSLALPNCGSVFRNPEGNSAGKLLDEVGAKGFSSGNVRVWENHANFIVNDKKGSSEDILNLIYKMYSEVKTRFQLELKPEIRFLGGNNIREVELCRTLNIK